MRLHVEDEIGRALLLGKGSRLEQFNLSNVEEPPKDRVHGQQRGGHPARGLQKISARETSSSCGPFHERDDKLFNAGLVRCLAEGSKFFVGDDLCRNGDRRVIPCLAAGRRGNGFGEGAIVPIRLNGVR